MWKRDGYTGWLYRERAREWRLRSKRAGPGDDKGRMDVNWHLSEEEGVKARFGVFAGIGRRRTVREYASVTYGGVRPLIYV